MQLDGYTEDDKVAIARQYLAPRKLERAALTTAYPRFAEGITALTRPT